MESEVRIRIGSMIGAALVRESKSNPGMRLVVSVPTHTNTSKCTYRTADGTNPITPIAPTSTCGVRSCLGWGEYTKAPYLGTITIARNEQRHYLNGMISGTIQGLIYTLAVMIISAIMG